MAKLMKSLQIRYGAFAKENDINFLDFTNIYDLVPSDETIWYDYVHLNDKGHKILDEKFASILIKQNLIK